MQNFSLTLKKKIYLFSIMTTFFFIGMSFIVYNDLNSLLKQFNNFRDTSAFAKEHISMSKNVEALKNNVQKFINSSSNDSSKEVYKIYDQINSILVADNSMDNIQHKENFSSIQNHLSKYFNTFTELEQLVKARRDIKNKKMNLIQEIETDIDTYFSKKNDNENIHFQYELHASINTANQHTQFYFNTLDVKYIKQSKQSFYKVKKQIAKLIEIENNKQLKSDLILLKEKTLIYSKVALKEIQQTKGYMFLINVVMAAEAYEIQYFANAITKDSENILNNIDEDINNTIKATIKKMAISTLSFFLLLLLFSLILTKNIIRPISLLTHSFKDISSGKTKINIPGYNVNDEIGELTKAAEIFLTQNIEIKDLLEKSNKLAENLHTAKLDADKANKAKSDFLANMSHEIRTPMTGLLGFVDRLQKSEQDPERQKQFKTIRNSGETLLSIINDILDFSKIESGKMEIESSPIQLTQICESSIDVFTQLASAKNINLINATATESLPNCIFGDETRLKQVVFNLMSNALKFTNSGGNITLQSRFDKEKSLLYIAVIDTGVGIAQKNLEKIFKAFSQEDASTTRKFGGTGLGLTISSRLTSLMDGELKVESKVGEGSKFYFELPVKVCTESFIDDEGNTTDGLAEVVNLQGHALIVEDNKTNQMLMGMLLDDLGITYDIANDGAEGVLKYKQNNYDIILMDENMPIMNGIEATQIIREEEEETTSIPIIAVTANALVKDRERFLDAGMNDYISKPYTEEDIVKVLKKYLG